MWPGLLYNGESRNSIVTLIEMRFASHITRSVRAHRGPSPSRLPRVLAAAVAALMLAVLVVLAPAPTASAEVEITVRPDGSRVVRNLDSGKMARSQRGDETGPVHLRPVPRAELAHHVEVHAGAHGVDPRLVRAVIQAESAWDRRARSRTGAMGLMQLMPETAVELAVSDPWEEGENIRGGTAYLARQIASFGSLELALAAYNAGPGAVKRYGGIPPFAETREYVRRVLSLYHGRVIRASELVPFHGRKRPSRRGPAASAPGFVRNAEGRLVLTNEPRPSRRAP